MTRLRAQLVAALAVALLSVSCIPMPPGTYPGAVPGRSGPNIVRATVFQGLGAWWDFWDWSPTFNDGKPKFGLADVDRLAASGVQTLYIQTATYRHPDDVLDRACLRRIIGPVAALTG